MDRREMLKVTTGGLILAAAGSTVFAAEKTKQPAAHQHQHEANKNQGLIDAAADSVKKGQACLGHGLWMLSQREYKDMAVCAMRVSDMVAACTAIEQLASYNSPNLVKMARVVMDICKDCEKECRKFEKDEEICKQTADSCVTCFNECKKIAA
ncbi:MAG: four-helix bundle copper-binding protein [Gallionella sp.]|nr:four-helix bundle copper-binding protein [Gallionella sp.]